MLKYTQTDKKTKGDMKMKQIGTVAIIGLGAIGAFFADSLLPALNDGLRIIAGKGS